MCHILQAVEVQYFHLRSSIFLLKTIMFDLYFKNGDTLMSNKKTITTLSIAAGTAFIASLAMGNVANAAEGANPFAMNELSGGYMQLAEGKCGEGKCGGKKEIKKMEGKCGEGKCGGAKEMNKNMEGKCGGNKAKSEGKCGEGKCGGSKKGMSKGMEEGKCGGSKKAMGEGKCGGK